MVFQSCDWNHARTTVNLFLIFFLSLFAVGTQAAPTITSLSATSGAVGASVTITGTNFGSPQGTSTVKFNGTAATVTTWTTTSIVTTVPSGATTGNVIVTVSSIGSNGIIFTVVPAPNITSLSRTSGAEGASVTITGTNFGSTGTVKFNGTTASTGSWTPTSIITTVPVGATTGNVVVNASGVASNGKPFTVTLPSGWSDSDVGSVGIAGSATYLNGTFTVKGSGTQIYGTADAMHFAYRTLSGDGTIVARVVTVTGSVSAQPGVMIREALTPGSNNGFLDVESSVIFYDRDTTDGSTNIQAAGGATKPYWVKLVRNGNNFTGYSSNNGLNWVQVGTSQAIAMSQTVNIGLAVSSEDNGTLATATFDNVSVSFAAVPAPAITNVSATTGAVGTQVVISGANFGATRGNSTVNLNAVGVTIGSWSNSSITITIPTGATSGNLVVAVAPSMNNSNPVRFTVTSQALPAGWLDSDVGFVGVVGSATYSGGTFTVKASGDNTYPVNDGMHLVYQSLTGDGTIVARVVSLSGGTNPQAGVMIRETLDAGSSNAFMDYDSSSVIFYSRATNGENTTIQSGFTVTPPYWVRLIRTGDEFTAYASLEGQSWTQIGATQEIEMEDTVYLGLAVSNGTSDALATALFDNVSVSTTLSPAPVINGISASTGSIGSQLVISGSGFGATSGSSQVRLNGLATTINSWSDTAISITIPTGAQSGFLAVAVAPSMNCSNAVRFQVTTHPLTPSWVDGDVGNVQLAGSSSYANGTFTVSGSGSQIFGTADGMHFAYQTLSADGAIVARVVTTGGSANVQAGVMIRETLNPGSTNAFVDVEGSVIFYDRDTTSGSTNIQAGGGVTKPYWVKLVRNGNNFTGYSSNNGLNWVQVGTSQAITMAQNVDIGLAVSSMDNAALATATFDNVSITSAAAPAPVITSISATTGPVGTQVVISGANFAATQGSSTVNLNTLAATVGSWSNSSITITIPTGATSGNLVVAVAPSMNNSNPVRFTITSQALPAGWLDSDVGFVGVVGSATYSGGTFTIKASGDNTYPVNDGMHLAYQSLTGDGTIVARVVSLAGDTNPQAGVMIRETLNAGSTNAFIDYDSSSAVFYSRATTGANTTIEPGSTVSLPYWVRLVRSGSSFSGYASSDGLTWTQIGTTQTVTMAQTVYIALVVSNGTTGTVATGTFDNVSITRGTVQPLPVVSSISPILAGFGTSITINGSNFGATQGSNSVSFNGVNAASVTSWTNTQIVATVPSGTTTGPLTVFVSPLRSNTNVIFTVLNPVITSISPPAGPVGGSILLTGSGFYTNLGVGRAYFNGVPSTYTAVLNDTSISAAVPAGVGSGPVTVTIGGVTSNGLQFTVIEALNVNSISPAFGDAGSSIIISGSGFGPTQSGSAVSFNGVSAATTSWSDTQITAVVPQDAPSGPIYVQVAGIEAKGPLFGPTSSVSMTDSKGNQSTYTAVLQMGKWFPFQSQGSGCSTCTTRGHIIYAYDGRGNLLTMTDALGHSTTYTYDLNYNVLSETVPISGSNSATTTYTYNSFGEVMTVTDPLGNVTSNDYDANGNLLSVTTPAPGGSLPPSATQFGYDAKGELTTITDPLNNVTRIAYFPTGLIQTITDAQNNVTTYAYDLHGNRTSVTDAALNQTTFAYDAADRLTTITYPSGGGTTAFTYDIRGRRTSITDQNGKTTTYAYDDADRLTTITDAANGVTTYGYDSESNPTSIQNANVHTTNFAYDAFGRVSSTTFPSTNIETYGYDANNNLTSKTDRKNQLITYTYDQLNRLTQKSYPDTTAVNYTYDNDSRLTQVSDPTGTYQFTFDNMGRLTGTTTQYTFLAGRSFTTAYGYDAASNRTGFTDPESGATAYIYDTLNRLQTLTPPVAIGGGNFGFGYDALSRRTSLTRPNGVNTTYAYDNLSRLLSVTHAKAGTTLDGASYTVDNVGNRLTRSPLPSGTATTFGYDNLYELLSATQGGTPKETYTYDPVGNRLSNLAGSGWNNNDSNELTARPGIMYTYDNNGNTQTMVNATGTTTYTWDYENRLASVALPGGGGTVSFKYDPFGRRIYKSSSSSTSVFAYDGDNLVEETNGSGGVVARYSQGINIDEPLAMLRSSTTSYYQADGLGSVTSLSNGAGALAQTYTFDSFGKLTASSGSLINPFQYTAREFDGETGLYFYRARSYDPSSGRFLSEDPLRHDAGVSFYSYVVNNPLNFTDPLGLLPQANSVQSSITQAIARGDVEQVEAILSDENMSAQLTEKSQAVAREAIKKLRTKAQDWIGQKCKGSVNQEFPSQLKDKTLAEIKQLSQGKGDLADAARKAWKLLNDSRFQK